MSRPVSPKWIVVLPVMGLIGVFAGCQKSEADRALETDANGYFCAQCKAKFYTDRKVFAFHCPACKFVGVDTVQGFTCPDDKHVTYGPRGRGGRACEQCGKFTSAISIPREAELKAWGAEKKTAAEVGVK